MMELHELAGKLKRKEWKYTLSTDGSYAFTKDGVEVVAEKAQGGEGYKVTFKKIPSWGDENLYKRIYKEVLPEFGFSKDAIDYAVESGEKCLSQKEEHRKLVEYVGDKAVTERNAERQLQEDIKRAGIRLDYLPKGYELKCDVNRRELTVKGQEELFTIKYDDNTEIASMNIHTGTSRDLLSSLGVDSRADANAKSYQFKNGKLIGYNGETFLENKIKRISEPTILKEWGWETEYDSRNPNKLHLHKGGNWAEVTVEKSGVNISFNDVDETFSRQEVLRAFQFSEDAMNKYPNGIIFSKKNGREYVDGKLLGAKKTKKAPDTPKPVKKAPEPQQVFVPYRDRWNNIWYVPFTKAELKKLGEVPVDGPATDLVRLEHGQSIFGIPPNALQSAINAKVSQRPPIYRTASDVVKGKATDAVVTRTEMKRDYYGYYTEKIGQITQRQGWQRYSNGCIYQCTVAMPEVTRVPVPQPMAQPGQQTAGYAPQTGYEQTSVGPVRRALRARRGRWG